MDYVHQPYPSVRYHPDGRTKIVKNPEEDQALGEDWYDTPAAFPLEDASSSGLSIEEEEQEVLAPKPKKGKRK